MFLVTVTSCQQICIVSVTSSHIFHTTFLFCFTARTLYNFLYSSFLYVFRLCFCTMPEDLLLINPSHISTAWSLLVFLLLFITLLMSHRVHQWPLPLSTAANLKSCLFSQSLVPLYQCLVYSFLHL